MTKPLRQMSDQALLRGIFGGGVRNRQPLTSVLVPAVPLDGRTSAQAKRQLALRELILRTPRGRGLVRLKARAGRRSRRNPSKVPPGDVETFSDDQLLAALIGGSPDFSQLDEVLRASLHGGVSELKSMYGLTAPQARKLAMVGEVYRRLAQKRMAPKTPITNPNQAYEALGPAIINDEVESFWVVPLNARSIVIGKPKRLTVGDIDGTEAGVRVVLRHPIKVNAASFMIVHNHPTGDPTPSRADLTVTRNIVQASRIMDIPLVDHIIMATGGFYSLRAQNSSLWSTATS